jgi:hypothetical protein
VSLKIMLHTKLVGTVLVLWIGATGVVACYARATVGETTEECRTVEVRNRHDVEVCRTRCTDEGCRTRCAERERWSREHRCWVE